MTNTAASAVDIEAFLAGQQIVWANNSTTMSLYNIRLHLRVYKKCAGAVKDPATPAHEGSALYWLECNEELWGRRASQCVLQEQPRSLDTFVSAFNDMENLRLACETFHVMNLRGFGVKFSVKHVSDTAKALPYYTKIPHALISRYNKHAALLEGYSSLLAFHESHPEGMLLTGEPVQDKDKKPYPIFASEFLDVLWHDLLLPLFTFKKHASLCGVVAAPLGVPFVKDALDTLDSIYARETDKRPQSNIAEHVAAGGTEIEEIISDAEAKSLKTQYAAARTKKIAEFAAAYAKNNVCLLTWKDADLLGKISMQPMIKDGTTRLWFFNSGCDCTKDPAKRLGPYRMKSSVDDEHLKTAVDITLRMLADPDTGIFTSGRNVKVEKELRRAFGAAKPALGLKHMTMEPDEDQVSLLLRLHDSAVGSVDLADYYLHVLKSPKHWKMKKVTKRRFVPGSTAFSKMRDIPTLAKDQMTKVPQEVRELVFRGVAGSDKFSPFTKSKDAAKDGETPVKPVEEEEVVDDANDDGLDEEQCAIINPKDKVVFFHMELHVKVSRYKSPSIIDVCYM